MRKKVYINDIMFRHCGYTALRKSLYMDWDFNSPENNDEETIVYTDCSLHLARNKSFENIGWLIESPEFSKKYYEWTKQNLNKFKFVITHDKELLDYDKKFDFVPIGGTWIQESDFNLFDKTKNFSLISSEKNLTEGHKLRHLIARSSNGFIDLYGKAYNPIENKITALKDYRYSFIIENCKKDYYFTEKLIDCFLTGTIPIYWGCPSIGNFFNLKGMIIFDNMNDLKDKIKYCTKEFYHNNFEYVLENFHKAKTYMLAEDYIFENKPYLLYD